MTVIQNLVAPKIGTTIQVELSDKATATISRVRAAYGNKREAMYAIRIERDSESLFHTNRRGVGAWNAIKSDIARYL